MSSGWGEREQPATPGSAVARIAGGLAQDLSGELARLSSTLALAERHAAGNPALIRLLATIREATGRSAAIAEDILALSPAHAAGVVELRGLAEEIALTCRILVVEDDPMVAELAVTVLQDLGHTVEMRGDAPSALARLRGSEPRFDLVFSDITMPGGMSGIDLAHAVAADFPATRVLLATGYSTAALAPGALRFPILPKPYSMEELTRRVTQMLPTTG